MMLSLPLRSWRPILHMSTPSMSILPSLGSTMRNMAWIKVDFPLPVLPTTPTLLFPGNVHVMFFKTDGRCSAYLTWKHCQNIDISQQCSHQKQNFFFCVFTRLRVQILNKLMTYQTCYMHTCKLLKQIVPIDGQFCGGLWSSITRGASLAILEYCKILSTDIILFSALHMFHIIEACWTFRFSP